MNEEGGSMRICMVIRSAVAVATAGVLLSGCGASRQEMLDTFGLQLPACETENLRFSGSKMFGPQMTLSFTAPKSCADKYLTDHGVKLAHSTRWPYGETIVDGKVRPQARTPFPEGTMDELGLKVKPGRSYPMYTAFTTPKDPTFDLLVDEQGDRVNVYLVSVVLPD
ncbi:hypothetical protein [Streptomyces sp. NPDC051567]|uniref:hypothetical protein n=1 Tax=Streptomyces sp. NPDC051567 TaxID=3365660 RepID=UPI00378A5680